MKNLTFNEFREFCNNNFNILFKDESIYLYKKGSKIKIKESTKGSFTRYCKGKVTDECIRKGKNSSSPAIRKKATFAANSRKWNH